jgi:hypothetical protein
MGGGGYAPESSDEKKGRVKRVCEREEPDRECPTIGEVVVWKKSV